MSTITLLTSAGAVRVEGDNLVIDIRNLESGPTDEVRTEGFAIPPVAGTSVAFSSAPAESASDKISRIVSETPADTAPRRQATATGDGSSSPVTGSHSAPSEAETGRAGGPVCAPVTLSDPAERPSGAIFGERFSHPTSNVTTISSQPAGSVGVPHSKPHKSGKLEVQPANLSDPRDPGPIPTWMDKRAKKDAA